MQLYTMKAKSDVMLSPYIPSNAEEGIYNLGSRFYNNLKRDYSQLESAVKNSVKSAYSFADKKGITYKTELGDTVNKLGYKSVSELCRALEWDAKEFVNKYAQKETGVKSSFKKAIKNGLSSLYSPITLGTLTKDKQGYVANVLAQIKKNYDAKRAALSGEEAAEIINKFAGHSAVARSRLKGLVADKDFKYVNAISVDEIREKGEVGKGLHIYGYEKDAGLLENVKNIAFTKENYRSSQEFKQALRVVGTGAAGTYALGAYLLRMAGIRAGMSTFVDGLKSGKLEKISDSSMAKKLHVNNYIKNTGEFLKGNANEIASTAAFGKGVLATMIGGKYAKKLSNKYTTMANQAKDAVIKKKYERLAKFFGISEVAADEAYTFMPAVSGFNAVVAQNPDLFENIEHKVDDLLNNIGNFGRNANAAEPNAAKGPNNNVGASAVPAENKQEDSEKEGVNASLAEKGVVYNKETNHYEYEVQDGDKNLTNIIKSLDEKIQIGEKADHTFSSEEAYNLARLKGAEAFRLKGINEVKSGEKIILDDVVQQLYQDDGDKVKTTEGQYRHPEKDAEFQKPLMYKSKEGNFYVEENDIIGRNIGKVDIKNGKLSFRLGNDLQNYAENVDDKHLAVRVLWDSNNDGRVDKSMSFKYNGEDSFKIDLSQLKHRGFSEDKPFQIGIAEAEYKKEYGNGRVLVDLDKGIRYLASTKADGLEHKVKEVIEMISVPLPLPPIKVDEGVIKQEKPIVESKEEKIEFNESKEEKRECGEAYAHVLGAPKGLVTHDGHYNTEKSTAWDDTKLFYNQRTAETPDWAISFKNAGKVWTGEVYAKDDVTGEVYTVDRQNLAEPFIEAGHSFKNSGNEFLKAFSFGLSDKDSKWYDRTLIVPLVKSSLYFTKGVVNDAIIDGIAAKPVNSLVFYPASGLTHMFLDPTIGKIPIAGEYPVKASEFTIDMIRHNIPTGHGFQQVVGMSNPEDGEKGTLEKIVSVIPVANYSLNGDAVVEDAKDKDGCPVYLETESNTAINKAANIITTGAVIAGTSIAIHNATNGGSTGHGGGEGKGNAPVIIGGDPTKP